MKDQYQLEGLLLTNGSGDDAFADFYRQRIRYQKGARLPAAELRTTYGEWAEAHSAAPMSVRAIRGFMEANGHSAAKSNVMFYRDAVLGDFAGTPLPARPLPIVDGRPVREAVTVTVDDLDQIIAELQGIRRRLARIVPGAARNGRSS